MVEIMANEDIGINGGKYRARIKNSKGEWSPWLNLRGGLKTSDVEVELVEGSPGAIRQLQDDLERTRQASVNTMLGQLRLREAVLLYVGQDADSFAQQLTENFGSDVARAVTNSLFVLNNAPVPPEAREAFRKATNHGMNRW